MSFPGLTNHIVPIPGSTVTAYLGVWDKAPDEWIYTLFDENDNDIAGGSFCIPQPDTYTITPEQVANIAFLLEVEYS